MRVLHFSDFHLDYNNILKSQRLWDKMIEGILPLHEQKSIDLIIFTGDMVNVGGKSFKDIMQGFNIFNNLFIKVLLEKLNLSSERFIFCPGNHDVDRTKDDKYAEKGLTEELKSNSDLEDFFDNPQSYVSMKRVEDFKRFEREFYANLSDDEYQYSLFQSNFKLNIDGKLIGVTAINTAWRCWDSATDKGKILTCVRQLSDSESFLKDCDIKIALSHHSYTWMNDFEVLTLEKFLTKDYDLYFCGHTHSPNLEYCARPEGCTFKLVAPGVLCANNFEDKQQYRNGVAILDYNLDEGFVETSLLYQNDVLRFEIDKNYGTNGIWHVDIPLGDVQKRRKNMQEVIFCIKEEIEYLNKHLLSYNAESKAPKSLSQMFVIPNLTVKKLLKKDDKEIEENKITIDEIIKSGENYIIFGIKESGKTILIDKLLLEFLNNNSKKEELPVVIQFDSIKRDIESSIRLYWHQNKRISMPLIEECNIVLLVDDIDFSDFERMEILTSFLENHKKSRMIGTCLEVQKDDLILEAYTYPNLQYQKIELDEFNSHQIRMLADKWLTDINDSETKKRKIELLVNAFYTIDLPRTPFAVSMFLWIIERQENYRPQNNTILMKQFLEKLLQSNEEKGAPREQFDYINKTTLLSIIAKKMLDDDNDNYSLASSQVLELIEKHMAELEFEFYKATIIMQNFLDLGILVQDDKSRISFRFTCFFEYYLFIYMERNQDFKQYVLMPEHFLKFSNEIIHYTGIHRDEDTILKMIVDELEYSYIDINEIVFSKIKSVDDFFNVDKSVIENLKAEDLIKVLPEKQTIQEQEESEDTKMCQCRDNTKPGVINKKESNKFRDYSRLLLLSMNVLKNCEEIKEVGLKRNSYVTILRNSISYMVLFKLICEDMIIHSSNFPKNRIEELKFCLRLLPVLHEELISDHLGTYKLTQIIRAKINDDNMVESISEMEQFLSVFLYVDLKGKDYTSILTDFIKKFKKSYIADACFFKLSSYYYVSKDEKLDSLLIKSLCDMYIKINKPNDKNSRLNLESFKTQLKKKKQANHDDM